MSGFDAHHLSIKREDIAGNDGRGRIILLPGSVGRAETIAERLEDVKCFPSPRQLNVYVGTLRDGDLSVDVAAVPTGMGCPSVDIVVTELILLGARRLLRVGTAGSLQPRTVRAGDLVIATAAVRDEHTSEAYCPREVPAVAHPHWVEALSEAARGLGLADRTFAGVVHSKDSLYGREFAHGPLADRNEQYMRMLREMGVLGTEMETSHLLTLAAVHGRNVQPIGKGHASDEVVKGGTLLAIIGDDPPFAGPEVAAAAEKLAIDISLAGILELARLEARE